jgi:outer membrane protein TolC
VLDIENEYNRIESFDKLKRTEGDDFLLDGTNVLNPVDRVQSTNVFALKIEDARKYSLYYQLDIQAELIPPKIAKEQVREAQARFQALIVGSLDLDKANNSSPNPNTETLSSSIGLRVPLQTGGAVSVTLPVARQELSPLPAGVPPHYYNIDPTISLSQPLLRGAGLRINYASISKARMFSRQTYASSKLLINNLLANVDRGYWRLWAASQEVDVRHEQYKMANQQLQNAQKLVEAGIVPKLEITRSKMGLSQRVNSIILAETSRKILDREMKRIMNLNHLPLTSQSVIILKSEPTLFALDIDRDNLVVTALENRMDLLEAQLQVAIELLDKDVARNQLLPDLSLNYNYSSGILSEHFNSGISKLDNVDSSSWGVGVTFSYPLGNGAAKARLRQASQRHALSLNTLERRSLLIQQEVNNAIDRLIQSWQLIQAAIQETIFAQQIYTGELKQFESGFRTSTEVLDAAQFVANAQIRHIQAIADFEISKVELAYATGAQLGYADVILE